MNKKRKKRLWKCPAWVLAPPTSPPPPLPPSVSTAGITSGSNLHSSSFSVQTKLMWTQRLVESEQWGEGRGGGRGRGQLM